MTTIETKPRRGIFLLPNLMTTGGLFAGFYAIVAAMGGLFENAAIAIFVAMIMDGLDGRIARMTNTQSKFGAEFDSLADMVSFCVAPALVVYSWALVDLKKLGWLIAFVFVACGAMRLARFNTQVGSQDKRYFQGLATPASAAVLAALVWYGVDMNLARPADYAYLIGFLVVALSALNVSNFRYSSFKEFNWKGRVPFLAILVGLLVYVVVAYQPALVLLFGFSAYALSGPVATLWQMNNLRKKRKSRPKE